MNLIPVAVAICAGLVFGSASSSAEATCQAKMTAFPLDPGSKCCTHAPDLKIIGGTAAQIDQHPWAALIVYDRKKGGSKPLCSGTLISGKYVLTAAHCIVGQILAKATPTNVRLGDYDYNHEGPDCLSEYASQDCTDVAESIEIDSTIPHPKTNVRRGDYDYNHEGPECVTEYESENCTDGAVSIEIDSTIPHPKYAYSNHPSQWNDIGLIRMKKTAPYTDFIRPICLPTTNLETNPPERSLFVVSWSQNTGRGIKSLYEVPFVSQEKCKPIYSKQKIVLTQGQICAGGLEGMDACKGDGGGPLVYNNKDGSVELTGIVSFGPKPCGQKDFPSVYTNVYAYLTMIKTIIVE